MAARHDPESSLEARLQATEEQLKALQGAIQALKGELSDLGKALESLTTRIAEWASRYVMTCPACSTRFDMLAHHYSIGLFDNMVYVKCPKCNKALPIRGGSDGGIRAITDELA